jgi:Anti-sigma factor NepR
MSEKQSTVQRLDQRVRERIGQQLRGYYGSYIGEELPPRLLAVLKKLDEETESEEENTSTTINAGEPLA